MTYARAHLVDTDNGGFYHCISRCVRRSWLCGEDAVSGRSYEHRREWVEARLLELSSVFAVDLHSYAVMSNHYHCVVEVTPRRVDGWSDEEVARRWCLLSPGKTSEECALKYSALLANESRLAEIRHRLGSLSWFMRFINEPIARRANREDGATGRFWEGRFKSVALLDDGAVLACMAYVDLNPIRARCAERVEDAVHTSICRRLQNSEGAAQPLAPLSALSVTLAEYRALLDWTVATERGVRADAEAGTARLLARLGQSPVGWLDCVKAQRRRHRAYGALELLRRYAESLGQRYVWGAGVARTATV